MSLSIIAVVLIGTLIVRINSLEHEVSENEVWSIKCPSMGDGIEIVDAKWAYDRASISNMFTPNIRNYAFVWGAYLNMCTWDVSTGMKSRCALENECIFTPTREALGDCGYKMYLRVRYECRNDIETQQKLSSDQRCYHIKDYNEYAEEFNYCSDWHSRHKRQSPDDDDPSQRCTILFGIMDVAASLERNPALQTHSYTNMSAVTSITTRQFPRGAGATIDLVYVMRARITPTTIQEREDFPERVAQRMRELDARRDPAGRFSDERGHLLASTLGGPQHRLNIAPQVCSVNRCYPSNTFSFWRKIEQEIRTSIDSGRVRHIDWTLVINYDNLQRNDMRPTGFGLRYITHFNNGRACDSSDLYISNEAGSCTLSPTYENVPRRTLTRSQSAPNIYELCGERRRGTKRKHSPDK